MASAAFLIESLTGNTWKAAEHVADGLQQYGWSITGLDKVKAPNLSAIQEADLVVVGTWVHGLFVVGQLPWAANAISNLPAMAGKRAAVFLTFGLNPGKSLEKVSGSVRATGANVLGGLALNRFHLEQHSEELTTRLVDAYADLSTPVGGH